MTLLDFMQRPATWMFALWQIIGLYLFIFKD
jgi:hypothetical protein